MSAVHVQACRALMIICLLFGLGSMIVALLGLKCIKIGSKTEQSKAKIATIGGILSIVAGECDGSSLSLHMLQTLTQKTLSEGKVKKRLIDFLLLRHSEIYCKIQNTVISFRYLDIFAFSVFPSKLNRVIVDCYILMYYRCWKLEALQVFCSSFFLLFQWSFFICSLNEFTDISKKWFCLSKTDMTCLHSLQTWSISLHVVLQLSRYLQISAE